VVCCANCGFLLLLLLQELVTSKLEIAQLNEAQVTLKRELYHAKETNSALEAKMVKLDALLQELARKCQ
jgi:hypothetical protein